jgi:dihydrofolate reductase
MSEAPWANSSVVDGDLVEFVTELRRQPGGDIGLHGSIALTQSLLEHGLVDELRLVIAPALQMNGRKLFDRGLSTRLVLTRNVTSPSGYLLLDFQVAGSFEVASLPAASSRTPLRSGAQSTA